MFKKKNCTNFGITLLLQTLNETYANFMVPVSGGSMMPYLNPGDLICFHKKPDNTYFPEDIIVFKSMGKIIAHRIIHKYRVGSISFYKCMGDAANNPDPPITDQNILGKVSRIIKKSEISSQNVMA